jgi:hypothetical protein
VDHGCESSIFVPGAERASCKIWGEKSGWCLQGCSYLFCLIFYHGKYMDVIEEEQEL